MTYGVQVEGIRLRFMSAHMATFGGDCEPLHGHNYPVAVAVTGGLTADGWVIDFSALKAAARALCDAIDHRFLLQTRGSVLSLDSSPKSWKITTPGGRGYVFPREDVAELPIENTTTEQLAAWMHGELAVRLRADGWSNLVTMRVTVEEAPGQAGWYEAALG